MLSGFRVSAALQLTVLEQHKLGKIIRAHLKKGKQTNKQQMNTNVVIIVLLLLYLVSIGQSATVCAVGSIQVFAFIIYIRKP